MFIFFIFLTILLYFVLNRKRLDCKMLIIQGLFLALIVIFMGCNLNNPDSYIYKNIYYDPSFFTKDPLFGLLVVFFRSIGISLTEFRILIAAFGVVLIHSSVLRFNSNIKVFYLLYFSFPFLFDVVQMRNYLGIAIIIFALSFYFFEKTKKRFFSYLFIAIACLIQKTHLIFFVLLPISRFLNKKRTAILFVVICCLFSLVFLDDNLCDSLGTVLHSIDLDGLQYFTSRITNYGWIIKWTIYLFNIFISFFISRRIAYSDCATHYQVDFSNFVFKINAAASICLPLYIVNPTFFRIERNIIILNYILIAIYYNVYIKTKTFDYKFIFYLSIILYSLIIFLVEIVYCGYFESIFLNIFRSNLLF